MPDKRKSFQQFCPMATALDVVGERWTLLILRELLGGPARFQDLLDGLPGISRNLLTMRLRRLEEDGVLERVRRGGGSVYTLTEVGASIRPTLEQLAYWGARVRRVAPPEHQRSVRAEAMALQAILVHSGRVDPDVSFTVEVAVGDDRITFELGERPTCEARPSVDADARLRGPQGVFSDYLNGARMDGGLLARVSGSEEARSALVAALGG
ncbi:MAG: helix-turn-helix transcriptional regulator [Deltaproteobacteria bacterium]|nr:helix-turn-helix transcriptional regulator [Deltaproteobacteria bacterium]